MDWIDIHKQFNELFELCGKTKLSSGYMSINISPMWIPNNQYDIYIDVGTYDISKRPRHSRFGPYSTDEEAKIAMLREIEKMKWEIIEDFDNCFENPNCDETECP